MTMDDLIRRGDLFVSRDWENCTCPAHVIAKAPAVDAVRVVRCKDCKWWNHSGCAVYIVDDSDRPHENDFCSFGERRVADG